MSVSPPSAPARTQDAPARLPSPGPARRAGWKRWALLGAKVAGGLAILGAVVFGGLLIYARHAFKTHARKLPSLTTQLPDGPMNVLVLGSDSRAGLSAADLAKYDPTGQDRNSGQRSDSIILVHLDPSAAKAVLVSFPRDLRVRYPDGSMGKINGLYQKGPDQVIQFMQSYTSMPINHYVEVNFAGFNHIVEALGGVRVRFSRPIRDSDSGLNVPAGCVELKGDQALAFVRMRHLDSDFGRIARQQLFVRLMLDKIVTAGTLLNPVKLFELTKLASKNVITDTKLSLGDMETLTSRLRGFNSGRVDMRVLPSSSATIAGGSYVLANDRQAGALLTALRDRKPLPDYGRTGVSPIEPQDVQVSVLNGTAVAGIESKEADTLRAGGYVVAASGPADRKTYDRTVVYYSDGNDAKAGLVASALGAQIKPLPPSMSSGGDLVLVLGRDFAEGRATPPPSSGQSPQTPAAPFATPC